MPYKLLLADDSLTIQKVVELVLTPENFEIRSYNDGEQALQALESFVPDIILADIEMPKLNGYQLCEKIKNDMATGHIPVILSQGPLNLLMRSTQRLFMRMILLSSLLSPRS